MAYDPSPATAKMTGLSMSDNSPITSDDSFLLAMGKIQAQLTAIKSTVDIINRFGQSAIPSISIGGNQNITVVYDRPFVLPVGKALSDIKITPIVAGFSLAVSLDKIPVTEVSRSLTGCVLKMTNNSLITVSSGSLVVLATLQP